MNYILSKKYGSYENFIHPFINMHEFKYKIYSRLYLVIVKIIVYFTKQT